MKLALITFFLTVIFQTNAQEIIIHFKNESYYAAHYLPVKNNEPYYFEDIRICRELVESYPISNENYQ
jgi:hypothetical protein